jgi:hypothetical protein
VSCEVGNKEKAVECLEGESEERGPAAGEVEGEG